MVRPGQPVLAVAVERALAVRERPVRLGRLEPRARSVSMGRRVRPVRLVVRGRQEHPVRREPWVRLDPLVYRVARVVWDPRELPGQLVHREHLAVLVLPGQRVRLPPC